ncbi:Putative glutathione S-transferase, Thioredoxin-like superfamily, glutathione Transferase family [Septoria linicola]|uniref:Glutathione S-transferase, Thioredoxin-like superfamily, glutathione Transferase family n=1 Tax=Septoria linicola TaxID=215465 RepID=A0A9Q9EFN8_9PEZI|nr:putative glutathione S-transferase, Thioredoxin-like superfamily, glutathione Transferase family [Septoria linicola]USW49155.1 Putative glutathione S-transferase, Thioredoxin-like superfamily, glutathione Transferase family [Septoria linicola]
MTTNGLTPTTFEVSNGISGDANKANPLKDGKDVVGPKITLYTNHRCPYAHRAHITLAELGIPFEEVIIDLDTPRPQWYLDINPRGLVPSIKYTVEGVYDEEIITESAIVAQFLADSFPSHLLPGLRDSPRAPLTRARIAFFVDTWNTKVSSFWFGALLAEGEEKEKKVDEWVKAVEKEIEPLLSDAKPFFGGSEEFTFAEVHAAPFVVRWYSLAKYDDLLPPSLIKRLDALPNFSKWARAIHEKESVNNIEWDSGPDAIRKKLASIKAAKK